ncbi:phage holin family protein [uncultured Clostridium sp.]|uniref:phage holin family protein n=1 Tax=uncultured Clostridium sp. TaxID=59620 RepID=UPI00261D94DF|nr:phage holin family protein [uncultured Clostridium sp.]
MKALIKLVIIFVVTYVGIKYLHMGTFTGITPIIIFAVVLMIVNLVIRPVIQLISLPITCLTFGLFALVVNVLMILLASALVPGISINGFFPAVLISIGIAVLTSLVHIGENNNNNNN